MLLRLTGIPVCLCLSVCESVGFLASSSVPVHRFLQNVRRTYSDGGYSNALRFTFVRSVVSQFPTDKSLIRRTKYHYLIYVHEMVCDNRLYGNMQVCYCNIMYNRNMAAIEKFRLTFCFHWISNGLLTLTMVAMYVWSNIVTQSLNNFCNGKALMRCFVCCLVTHYSQQYKNIECTTKTAFKVNLFRWQQYNIVGLHVKWLLFLSILTRFWVSWQALRKCSNIKDNGNACSGYRADTCRQTTEGQTDRQGSCWSW